MVSKDEKEDWLPEHGSVKPENIFKKLHNLSFKNKELLDLEDTASCFHCFSYISPKNIKRWTDEGQTAICPCCDIDSVLPGKIGSALLNEMYNRYFEFEA